MNLLIKGKCIAIVDLLKTVEILGINDKYPVGDPNYKIRNYC